MWHLYLRCMAAEGGVTWLKGCVGCCAVWSAAVAASWLPDVLGPSSVAGRASAVAPASGIGGSCKGSKPLMLCEGLEDGWMDAFCMVHGMRKGS